MARSTFFLRTSRQPGFSLAEMAVVLGILAVLAGLAVPLLSRYRGHTSVNSAAEITEGLLVRAREEARASGYPLPETLRASGVSEPAPTELLGGDEGDLVVRLRKRTVAGAPPAVLISRNLSASAPLQVQLSNLGRLDLDADISLQGVYLELLLETGGGARTLCAVPVDVNGEMALLGNQTEAAIHFVHKSYVRSLKLTHRGVVTPDRR